jgi:uncharacterized protein (DUF302 family)
MPTTDVVEVSSRFGFEETLQRLDTEITGRGQRIFARVDHADNARSVGLTMRPTTVVIFGNAKGGTPLMLKAPGLALDLPLRILVRQEPEAVIVSFHDPAQMVTTYGLSAEDAAALQGVSAVARAAAGSIG